MFGLRKKRRKEQAIVVREEQEKIIARKEREIQATHSTSINKIVKSKDTNKKLLELLEANGITLNIFVASGGARRMHK